MAKDLSSLKWIEDLLPKSYVRKHMFGGFAYYLNDKIILALFESASDRNHNGKAYNFELWTGCLFPTEKQHHQALKSKYPYLIVHPILSKWLYLPSDTEQFEDNIETLLKEVRKGSDLFGTIPKKKKTKLALPIQNINMKTPCMFSDEDSKTKLAKAKKISDLKNLGPNSEKIFHKAGIRTADQFIKLGWKNTMKKLVQADPRNRHSMLTYALIGALQNKEWFGLTETEKKDARDFTNSLKKKK